MSKTPPFSQTTEPLTVGNVVSAALRIYRDRFSTYFKLALTTYLWIFIPIYGWAKYAMLSGVISRLAFGEVREKPESVRDVVREVKPRMWIFLTAGILTSLIYGGVNFVLFFIFGFILGIIGVGGQNTSAFLIGITAILTLIVLVLFLVINVLLLSRYFIIEVALAVENDLKATSAISRSWQLTKGFFNKIQVIIMITFLITIPLFIVSSIFRGICEFLLATIFGNNTYILIMLYITMNIITGAFYLPFWQIVKAIIYYDIRTQKEGLGLELHSHQDL